MLKRLPSVLACAIVAAAYLSGGLDVFDHALMDLRYRLDKRPATDRLVLVEINESSLQRLDTWPWPRRYHADVVDRLHASGAAEIVLDIDFSSHAAAEDDARLARALADAGGRVILPAFRQIEIDGDGRPRLIETVPIARLAERARLASFNVRPDADGVIRRLQARGAADDADLPYVAALLAGATARDPAAYYVDFGIDMRSIARLSYADVLDGRFAREDVAGRIVLIGATAVQLGDMVTVPAYRSIPGIVLQALAYESLIQGRAMTMLGAVPILLIAATLFFAMCAASRRLSWRLGLATLAAGASGALVAAWGLSSFAALLVSPAAWLLALVLAYVLALFGRIEQQDIVLLLQGLAMRRRAAFMKMVVDNSFDAIVTTDEAGIVQTVNKAAESMFGYPADDIVGRSVGLLFAGPGRAAEDEILRMLAETGMHQLSAADRQGGTLYLDLTVSRMSVAGESLVIVIVRNVTERRIAERVARRALGQLRDAIDTIPEAFALFDGEDRLVLCNDRYREVNERPDRKLSAGVSYAAIQAAAARDGLYAAAAADPDAWLAERMRDHAAPNSAIEQQARDGRWLLTNEHRTLDGGSIVIQTDITDLKRRESDMAALVAKFAQVAAGIAATTTGVAITEPRETGGAIVFVNPAFAAITGHGERETLGRRFDFLFGAETDARSLRSLADAVADERSVKTILRARKKDASGFWCEINVNPVKDETGRTAFFVWLVDDVSERIASEKALVVAKEAAEVSNRSKTEFLHNMSHELRTPLNAIIGFSEVMLAETFGPLGNPRYLTYAQDIYASGRHLLDVINDVLDIAKIEAGRFELHEGQVALAPVVDEALRLVRGKAARGNVALRASGADILPPIRADERVIKQVLLNLLDNAIKFTPAGGRVEIVARCEAGNGLLIAVTDTGIGIAPDKLGRVLEPFVQVDSALNRKYEGTGLGLPLAKRFVEMHGGELTLESRPGAGTTATVRLPASRVLEAPGVLRISTRDLIREGAR